MPAGFDTWEHCRDFYSLEALFLGQLHNRRPGPRNKKRYLAAAQKATDANQRCEEPYPDEPSEDLGEG